MVLKRFKKDLKNNQHSDYTSPTVLRHVSYLEEPICEADLKIWHSDTSGHFQ